MSLIEALANVVMGYGVAVVTQFLVFPRSGNEPWREPEHRAGFVGLSLVRGYAIRRVFEAIRMRSA